MKSTPEPMRPTFGVQSLGFRVEGLQFGVWLLLKRLWGLGFD